MIHRLGSEDKSFSLKKILPGASPALLFLPLGLSSLLVFGCSGIGSAAPAASGGVLDLRQWDFQRNGAVRLIGQWDFFPGRLLAGTNAINAPRASLRNVPDGWTQAIDGRAKGTGAGTYRLKVLLPDSLPMLGIAYTTLSTAFELDADGEFLAHAGRPALEPTGDSPAFAPGTARLGPVADSIILVVRASNYEYRIGGMWRPFTLGPAEPLERRLWAGEAGSLALASSLAVLAVIFAFFVRGGIEGRGFLLFSCFSLLSALRAIVTGNYALMRLFPSMGFDLLIRLEYFSAYSIFPLGLLLMSSVFPSHLDSRVTKALLALGTLFLLLVPFAPLRALTWSIQAYYPLACLFIAAVGAITVRAASRRIVGGLPILIGATVLAAAAINDMLYSSFIVDSGNFFSYGMLIFIGTQAYALAGRHGWAQAKLKQALEEKELLIREVHHRVKNSLQIVSSIATLHAHRVDDPAMLAAYSSMQGRIRAISLVHEKLYALGSGEVVEIGAYARNLAALLADSYGIEGESAPAVDAESAVIPADLCIDLGIIMTELVANSYKHAVGFSHRGKIRIRIRRRADTLAMSVEDDGPGFPEGSRIEGFSTLGFRLISSLAKKHGASVEIAQGSGATVEICFPLSEPH